jgi:NRPS condensation-like uncharacterized protein
MTSSIFKETRIFHFHLFSAEASFAQSRIVLDEQIRFHSSTEKVIAIYNLPLLYRLSAGSLSIEHLRHALRQITLKHSILRTSLQFDPISGNLTQRVHSNEVQDWFICHTSIIDDDDILQTIFKDEITNRAHFNLVQGQVSRCHIVRRRSSLVNDKDDVLSTGDWIIFNFHHAAFDGESEQIFLDDLQEFYNHEQQLQLNNSQTALEYIDCKLATRLQ